jgi:esterase/lipase
LIRLQENGESRELTKKSIEEIFKLQDISKKNLENLKLPILVLLIEEDRTIDNKTIEEYFKLIPSDDKTIIRYPHITHNSLADEEVFVSIKEWLNK